MTATARQLPEPAADLLDPINVAYACAYCDQLEIEVLSAEHTRAWNQQRHHDELAILKRLRQIKGIALPSNSNSRRRAFASGYTTW